MDNFISVFDRSLDDQTSLDETLADRHQLSPASERVLGQGPHRHCSGRDFYHKRAVIANQNNTNIKNNMIKDCLNKEFESEGFQ